MYTISKFEGSYQFQRTETSIQPTQEDIRKMLNEAITYRWSPNYWIEVENRFESGSIRYWFDMSNMSLIVKEID